MKRKVISLLIISLFLFSLILPLIKAQEVPGMPEIINPEKTGEKIEKVGEITEKVQDTNYLQQEWAKLLEKNKYFGPVVDFLDKNAVPVLKILTGHDVKLSWLFAFILVLFIGIIWIAYFPFRNILNMNPLFSLICSIIIASLGLRAIPQEFLETQLKMLWAIIFILILVIIMGISQIFSKKIKEKLKKEAEERREFKAETVEKLHDIELKPWDLN